MATKSKSDSAVFWSVIAIVIATLSIAYCISPIIEMVWDGMDRSNKTIAYFTRLIKGSV